MAWRRFLGLALFLTVSACSPQEEEPPIVSPSPVPPSNNPSTPETSDSGTPEPGGDTSDGGTPSSDAGTSPDAGTTPDSGTSFPDAGTTPDSGTSLPDAGAGTDGGFGVSL